MYNTGYNRTEQVTDPHGTPLASDANARSTRRIYSNMSTAASNIGKRNASQKNEPIL